MKVYGTGTTAYHNSFVCLSVVDRSLSVFYFGVFIFPAITAAVAYVVVSRSMIRAYHRIPV